MRGSASTNSRAALLPIHLTVTDWFTPDFHNGSNDNGNVVVFRAFVPWSLDDIQQLTRLTVTITSHSAGAKTHLRDWTLGV
jgi:hypothetical protein